MTDQEREEFRQHNGQTIEMLCRLGEELVKPLTPKTPAEQCGMTETQYRHAESLYLHGDLSGR